MTGVILAAGEGRRMGPIGEQYPKALLPVVNRPLVAGHLDMLRAMGVADVVIVVGWQGGDVAREVARHVPDGMTVRFVEQPKRLGIAHALYQTREVAGDHVVMVLGDTYFVPGDLGAAARMLREDDGGKLAGVLSMRTVGDPDAIRKECTVRFDEAGRLLAIREKPETPWNDQKPCGIYFFSSRAIFDAIERTPPSALRGEVEITDSIQTLVDLGLEVRGAPTVAWDMNINFPGDLLAANLVDLRRRGLDLALGEGARIDSPAVARSCVIGRGARVSGEARLERVLVLSDACVDRPGEYSDSILGVDFALTGFSAAVEHARSAA